MMTGWQTMKSWSPLLALLVLVAGSVPSRAQDTRTIRIILPFAALISNPKINIHFF